MFLKRLIIASKQGLIRDIPFHKGINLIVDERSESERQRTGNNVGKTTVLRLIDYCFGSKADSIYKDAEFLGQSNTNIKNFLEKQEVLITIELVESLEDAQSKKITVQRNFLKNRKNIIEINGKDVQIAQSDPELKNAIFKTKVKKPTFREIISKNIRVKGDRMDNIVKVLGPYAKNEVYEALYLFWLGISTDKAEAKGNLTEKQKLEKNFQKRLKKEDDLPLIEQKLVFLNDKIGELEKTKENFNLNEHYDKDVKHLNEVKVSLNKLSSTIGQLEVRRELILESKNDLEQEYANINPDKIKFLYDKANALIPNIQVSFEKTLEFHNDLISEKLRFITKELPELEQEIKYSNAELTRLTNLEIDLTQKLQKSGVIEDLGEIIAELTRKYESKGNLEERKRLWEESSQNLDKIKEELGIIDRDITSHDDSIKSGVTQFNKYFPKMSEALYGEEYILSAPKENAGYALTVTNIESNPGSGKKKGQIAAFDFAYIQFADYMGIECLHFIMHDQLENIHDNQLKTLIEVSSSINGQYIVPILRDKIPSSIDIDRFEVLVLSQDEKLFKLP